MAAVAEQDGKVIDIDPHTRLATIEYQDGTNDVFKFGEEYSPFASMMATHDIKLNVKLGQKVKKNDVITYNAGYFKVDPETNQLDMTIGILANVACLEMDITNEDSAEISQSMADKLTIHPTNIRTVILKTNSRIYDYKKLGDKVNITDTLVVFDEEAIEGSTMFDVSEETMNMMSELNRRTPKAKFSGEIVKLNAYSVAPISEMHPSLQKLFKECVAFKNARAKAVRGTLAEDEYVGFEQMKEGSKYLGITFDKDTVVVVYYIKESIPHDLGSKIVVANQLKATVAQISKHDPETESGVPVDIIFSPGAIERRIVVSAIKYGILSRIMEKVEKDAVSMYFDE